MKREHATSAVELAQKLVKTTNPVTRSGYKVLIANRLNCDHSFIQYLFCIGYGSL